VCLPCELQLVLAGAFFARVLHAVEPLLRLASTVLLLAESRPKSVDINWAADPVLNRRQACKTHTNTASGPTSLQDMRIASGAGPLGQHSLNQPCSALLCMSPLLLTGRVAAHRQPALPSVTACLPPLLVWHRFWTGVRQGPSDVSTGITITGNSFIGGWPNASLAPAGVQGISFSAAATSQNAPKNWLIEGNKISGVNTAFEIRWPSGSSPAYSMVGMDINTNGIEANFQCPCYNVLNTSPAQPVVSNNWCVSLVDQLPWQSLGGDTGEFAARHVCDETLCDPTAMRHTQY